MKFFCLALIFLNTLAFSAPKTKIWSEILEQAVSDKGEVDYVWIKKNSTKARRVHYSFSNVDPEKWDEQEKKVSLYQLLQCFHDLQSSQVRSEF